MTEFLPRTGAPFIHLALQKCPGWAQVPMPMIRTIHRNARVVGRSGIKAHNPHDMHKIIKKKVGAGGRIHTHTICTMCKLHHNARYGRGGGGGGWSLIHTIFTMCQITKMPEIGGGGGGPIHTICTICKIQQNARDGSWGLGTSSYNLHVVQNTPKCRSLGVFVQFKMPHFGGVFAKYTKMES